MCVCVCVQPGWWGNREVRMTYWTGPMGKKKEKKKRKGDVTIASEPKRKTKNKKPVEQVGS